MNTSERDRFLDEVAEQLSNINDPEDENLTDAELVAIGANVAVEGLVAEIEQLRQQLANSEEGRRQAIDVAAERAVLIAQLQAGASREHKRAEVAERLLHDLTPMGSEFAGDPKRCFDWVREHLSRSYAAIAEKTVARREAEQALATERAGAQELRRVLRVCRHELVTLDNLTVSDGLKAYGEALDDGCDNAGAWDCYVEETWKIDTTKAVAEIDAALATDAGRGAESQETGEQ